MAQPGARKDPLPSYNFYISLIDSTSTVAQVLSAINLTPISGFSECTGLEATMQVEEYIEGGQNSYVHKFPTRVTYANIVLKRGMTFSQELWNWHMDYFKGRGKRRDGLIVLQDEARNPTRIWAFQRGLPVRWIGPTFNATQSAVAVETLEIAHEGWKPIPLGLALTQVGDAVSRLGQTISSVF
jgi:phage tail-like protein